MELNIAILILYMLIKRQNEYGFSLVELLVVISIIGVLSALLVANFMGMRERARDAQKIQDLYAIKNALRMYYNDTQSYPVGADCGSCLNTAIGTSYMPSISSVGYTYTASADFDSFVLKVGLEAGAGNEDIDSQSKCGISPVVDKVFAVCGN
jgi:prepilin-type N-terminal cleavage/methylation domain-containing protein